MDRVIGRINANRGPKLIVTGGIHGSEPAGVIACERVLEQLALLTDKMHGDFECFRGNLPALEKGVRFIDRDLNRMWDDATVKAALQGFEAPEPSNEFKQLRELGAVLMESITSAHAEVFFFDLHSTSSDTPPFFWLLPGGEAEIVKRFDMPTVHDPSLTISGTLAQYVAEQGHRVMLAEGGEHDDEKTVEYCEAMLWIMLVEVGLIAQSDVELQFKESHEILQKACSETHSFFNIVYHHKIKPADGFVMKPGYVSFQKVEKGEVLAIDAKGEVLSPIAGRILMPLYRPPCDDGFLIVQETGG
jgi:succinylglutamate desuccinylase